MVPVDLLRFALRQGTSEKIYQKDLIGGLRYSNKTVIKHLKTLTELGIINEHMEKVESANRSVWLKFYNLTDLGKWFALLIVEEQRLSREEKIEVVRNAFRSYTKWIKELSEKLKMNKEDLLKIFEEEIK